MGDASSPRAAASSATPEYRAASVHETRLQCCAAAAAEEALSPVVHSAVMMIATAQHGGAAPAIPLPLHHISPTSMIPCGAVPIMIPRRAVQLL